MSEQTKFQLGLAAVIYAAVEYGKNQDTLANLKLLEKKFLEAFQPVPRQYQDNSWMFVKKPENILWDTYINVKSIS